MDKKCDFALVCGVLDKVWNIRSCTNMFSSKIAKENLPNKAVDFPIVIILTFSFRFQWFVKNFVITFTSYSSFWKVIKHFMVQWRMRLDCVSLFCEACSKDMSTRFDVSVHKVQSTVFENSSRTHSMSSLSETRLKMFFRSKTAIHS